MRPIQWHLRNNWRVPESLEKVIQVPRSLHPYLQWWLKEDNALTGQPVHPIKHALQIFTDASIEGWGAHLDEHLARATPPPPPPPPLLPFREASCIYKLSRTLSSFSDFKEF